MPPGGLFPPGGGVLRGASRSVNAVSCGAIRSARPGQVENPASSRLTAVEDTEHHEPIAVEAILEDIRGAQHFEHDLPVLLTSRERPTKFRMSREHLRSGDDLVRNDCGKLGRLLVKKRGESIEVGEGVVRPFEIY